MPTVHSSTYADWGEESTYKPAKNRNSPDHVEHQIYTYIHAMSLSGHMQAEVHMECDSKLQPFIQTRSGNLIKARCWCFENDKFILDTPWPTSQTINYHGVACASYYCREHVPFNMTKETTQTWAIDDLYTCKGKRWINWLYLGSTGIRLPATNYGLYIHITNIFPPFLWEGEHAVISR